MASKTHQKHPKKAIIAGLIVLIVSISLFFGVKFFTNNTASYQQQQFTTITGATIKLSALLGKPVIVTFWATDCPSCIAEIPHWRALYQRYHPQGLEIIAIAMYYDPPSHVVSMTQAQQLPYPVVLDLHGQHAHAFGDVQLTPSTFLIAPDGSISFSQIGKLDFADLESRVDNHLKADVVYSSINIGNSQIGCAETQNPSLNQIINRLKRCACVRRCCHRGYALQIQSTSGIIMLLS